MKRKLLLSLGLVSLLLSLFLIPGCSDKELEELQVQLAEAKQKAEAALEEEAQSDAALEEAAAELAAMEKEYELLAEENAAIEAVQAELDDINARLAASQKLYDELSDNFTKLVQQYTPRDFSSLNELRLWLSNNTVSEELTHTDLTSWLTKAQRIQTDALADGYLVNINYFQHPVSGEYYVHCTTAINGWMYAWDPDDDYCFYDSGITGVK